MALTLSPQIDLSAIDRANLADSTKLKYKREITKLYDAGINPLDHHELIEYAQSLKSSRRAFLKSALRTMSADYEQTLKASATPENLPAVQSALLRLEAMNSVTVTQPKGSKVHTWLTAKQVKQMTALCDDSLEGKRDWIVLGLLLGAGLRREELVTLTFDDIKQVPSKKGVRHVLHVTGKGSKARSVPISTILAKRLEDWRTIVSSGFVARSLGRSKELGESMSAVAVFHLVEKYGKMIGMDLAPHDLRRTFAQLGYEAGVPLTQLSKVLGHANVTTTQRYLNLDLDLEASPSDFIPLSGD